MPATVRYDEQYCPIARALDVLGDRWTLLILRELVMGEQRFTDLRDHLPGIAPTLLTQRLRTMTEQGLVGTSPKPHSSRSAYTVTERGRAAIPVMRALARFGMPLLEPLDDSVELRPKATVTACLAAYYDPAVATAAGIDERYLVRVDDEEVVLSSVRGGGAPREPVLELESASRAWFAIRRGELTLREAIARGVVQMRGKKDALKNFQRVFQLP